MSATPRRLGLSWLTPEGKSDTTIESFNRAADFVARARANLRGPAVSALVHGILDEGTTAPVERLHLELKDEHGGWFMVSLVARPPAGANDDRAVVDMAEAMHIAMMIVTALGVVSITVGSLTGQANRDLLSEGKCARQFACELVAPDHVRATRRERHSGAIPADRPGVIGGGADPERLISWDNPHGQVWTSTAVFNWAAKSAMLARDAAPGNRIEASIWVHRNDRLLPVMTIAFEDELKNVHFMDIDVSGRYDLHWRSPQVPTLADALHMAGLLAAAVGAEIKSIGVQQLEFNTLLTAAPIELRGWAGMRANADHLRRATVPDRGLSLA